MATPATGLDDQELGQLKSFEDELLKIQTIGSELVGRCEFAVLSVGVLTGLLNWFSSSSIIDMCTKFSCRNGMLLAIFSVLSVLFVGGSGVLIAWKKINGLDQMMALNSQYYLLMANVRVFMLNIIDKVKKADETVNRISSHANTSNTSNSESNTNNDISTLVPESTNSSISESRFHPLTSLKNFPIPKIPNPFTTFKKSTQIVIGDDQLMPLLENMYEGPMRSSNPVRFRLTVLTTNQMLPSAYVKYYKLALLGILASALCFAIGICFGTYVKICDSN